MIIFRILKSYFINRYLCLKLHRTNLFENHRANSHRITSSFRRVNSPVVFSKSRNRSLSVYDIVHCSICVQFVNVTYLIFSSKTLQIITFSIELILIGLKRRIEIRRFVCECYSNLLFRLVTLFIEIRSSLLIDAE